MKVVINRCFGGFGLSQAACDFLGVESSDELDGDRANLKLVECVEKLGSKANGSCANLVVVEIPDNTQYHIEEYDGLESIDENHQSWS